MATDTLLLAHLLFLIIVANGVPVLAHAIFKHAGNRPLDAGMILADGQPLFGPSKTVRGVILSLLVTAVTAFVFALPWHIGAIIGAGAMLGDLVSSFTKRRLRMASSSQAFGLDQIPESLLPLLLVKPWIDIAYIDIALLVVAFVVLGLVLSRVLYRLRLRERPY